MAWIRIVSPARAEREGGLLARLYDAAMRRAGRVYQIIRLQSLRPPVLRSSTQLYLEVMHSRNSALSRSQREMIATAVSRINDCHYWTEAHGDDLRAEVAADEDGDRLVAAIKTDYRDAVLSPADRAMLDYAARLTREPAAVTAADLDDLRRHGFDDGAIHDIAQVTALFNYYNRLADGLGIDLEPEMPPHPRPPGEA